MLRTLVRDKASLVAESGDWIRRMQKSLDQMNVRLHRAVSELDGATGMAILRAIVNGELIPTNWRSARTRVVITARKRLPSSCAGTGARIICSA